MQLSKDEYSKYASAIRSSSEQILNEYELIESQKIFTEMFGVISGIGAIINKNRQIIFANENFLSSLEINDIESVLGKRPGEIISCINAENNTGGCGTSHACSLCGAVNAILESQNTGRKTSREVLITSRINGRIKSLDLNITSTPITLSGHTFYAIVLQDISHEKRRAALERIFFHDLLNSAGVVHGMLSLLKEGVSPGVGNHLINLSEEASREIIDEIQMHRHLLAAENGDISVNICKIDSLVIINDSINRVGFHESGRNKKIIVSPDNENIAFESDRVILQRILINLLKNALEATSESSLVTIGCKDLNEKEVLFWVKNDQMIPTEIQMQMFQRSFSTKGKGRGLGTYSIRLLTENYLKGTVFFTSSEEDGTVFKVKLAKIYSS